MGVYVANTNSISLLSVIWADPLPAFNMKLPKVVFPIGVIFLHAELEQVKHHIVTQSKFSLCSAFCFRSQFGSSLPDHGMAVLAIVHVDQVFFTIGRTNNLLR